MSVPQKLTHVLMMSTVLITREAMSVQHAVKASKARLVPVQTEMSAVVSLTVKRVHALTLRDLIPATATTVMK